jgi:hypothetical protein
MRREARVGSLVLVVMVVVALPGAAQTSNVDRGAPEGAAGCNVLTPVADRSGAGILYAPSEADDPGFRAAVAAVFGDTVDYFDARAATPDPALLASYDCVYTWTNYAYADSAAFGNNLADAVDLGATVVLGVFTACTGCGNYLSGRIMTAGYSPAYSPTGSNLPTWSDYAGDGATPIHDGVARYGAAYRDDLALLGTGLQDGSYLDGEIAHAYRPDFKVAYSNGMSQYGGSGDWPLLVANACRSGARDVLVFDTSSYQHFAQTAAATVAAAVTVRGASDFNSTLTARPWDLVLVDCPGEIPLTGWADLVAFANGGGRTVMSFWDWDNDSGYGDPALLPPFGITSTSSFGLVDGASTLSATTTAAGVYAFAGVPEMPHSSWFDSFSDDGDGFSSSGAAIANLSGVPGSVVVQSPSGRGVASFVVDEWQGDGAADLWRNLALRVLPPFGLEGRVLQANWLYPDFATILEAHPLVAGPGVDLTDAEIVNSNNFTVNIFGPFIQVEFTSSASWAVVPFNGWRFVDRNGELPAIVACRLVELSPGVTGLEQSDVGFDAESCWVNLQGVMIGAARDYFRLRVWLGIFGDGFETGNTMRWSSTAP